MKLDEFLSSTGLGCPICVEEDVSKQFKQTVSRLRAAGAKVPRKEMLSWLREDQKLTVSYNQFRSHLDAHVDRSAP